jgi:hypothetical protein
MLADALTLIGAAAVVAGVGLAVGLAAALIVGGFAVIALARALA